MRLRLVALALFAFTIAGCSGAHQSALVTAPHVPPFVRQNGNPVQWRQFSCGQPCSSYANLVTVGGNMWFSSYSSGSLVQVTMKGTTTSFPLLSSMNPTALAVGSDGKLYAGAGGLADIDIMTTAGAVSQKPIPSGDLVSYYGGMTQGPDKNVWFVERGHVGRITTAGSISEFPYADATTTNYYGSITSGPDGNLWVTENSTSKIDQINTAGKQLAQINLGCSPSGGITSAGGFLWVNCGATLAEVATTGTVTPLYTGFGLSQSGSDLTVGPDGNPWFGMNSNFTIGEFNIAGNNFTFYFPPTNFATDYAVASGPDGNIWAIDSSNDINVYILNVISVTPSTLTFATPTSPTQNIVVSQIGTAAWTAVSQNTAIATVAQGVPASTFIVTPKAVGTTKVVVSDSKGNSFAVLVTVQ